MKKFRPSPEEALPESAESSLADKEAKRRSFAESYRGVINRSERLNTFISRFSRSPEAIKSVPLNRGEKPSKTPESDTTFTIERVADPVADAELQRAAERLKQAYAAAELNLPEEARNERRHEIKKTDHLTAQEDELAPSIGNILAEIHKNTKAAHATFQKKPAPSSPAPKQFARLSPLFQGAIIFVLGILAIALIGVAIFY